MRYGVANSCYFSRLPANKELIEKPSPRHCVHLSQIIVSTSQQGAYQRAGLLYGGPSSKLSGKIFDP